MNKFVKSQIKKFAFTLGAISIISGIYIYIANQAPEIKAHIQSVKASEKKQIDKNNLKQLLSQHAENCYSGCPENNKCNLSLMSCDILKNYLQNYSQYKSEYTKVLKRLCELGENESCKKLNLGL